MNPWFYIIPICLSAGFGAGWSLRGDHEDTARLRQVESADKKTKEVTAEVTDLGNLHADQQAAQVVKDRIITREVVRYVQVTPAADRCNLPGTWRMRHDAAASGKPSSAAELAVGTPDPVDDAAALETVGENYAAGRQYADQVNGWIDYWERVKSLTLQCK